MFSFRYYGDEDHTFIFHQSMTVTCLQVGSAECKNLAVCVHPDWSGGATASETFEDAVPVNIR